MHPRSPRRGGRARRSRRRARARAAPHRRTRDRSVGQTSVSAKSSMAPPLLHVRAASSALEVAQREAALVGGREQEVASLPRRVDLAPLLEPALGRTVAAPTRAPPPTTDAPRSRRPAVLPRRRRHRDRLLDATHRLRFAAQAEGAPKAHRAPARAARAACRLREGVCALLDGGIDRHRAARHRLHVEAQDAAPADAVAPAIHARGTEHRDRLSLLVGRSLGSSLDHR